MSAGKPAPTSAMTLCWHNRDKNGKDTGEIAGIGPQGVKTVHDEAEVEALEMGADIVLLNPFSGSPGRDRLHNSQEIRCPTGNW